MTTTENNTKDRSGLDMLLQELGKFVSAQAEGLADKASDKIGDVTDQLTDVAQNGGSLADIGGRMFQGDSPLKAIAGSKLSGLKDKVTDAASGLFGKGKGKGRKGGSTKATNIIEFIDVGVPLRTAYDQWTEFEDFSDFAKGVRSVSKGDDTTSDWKVKVGPSTRGWKATIQEQVPDDRIVWTSDGAKGTVRGCVSFHELGPSLTRILVVVEYYPSGFFEKTGNVWRAGGRRLRLDLKHFDRHVTLGSEEPEGWRGEIRDGEVVKTHEEAMEEEEAEEGEEGEEDEEGQEGYRDEEEGEEGAYDEDGEADQDEEDEDEDGAYEDEYDEDEPEEEEEEEYEDEYEDAGKK
ncbi:SRPBCC family protein [Streptomyces sp. NPDC085614]|uniref:SRPBCC family protein n=1 Tax=Streptomyces sp. NPDC085614 TaxID=3365733 RepID=UPI0037CEA994